VPADDPIRSSPYDIIGQANLQPSPTATQPTVAKTTRVCAYDRPNTRQDGSDRSTPVPQPHSMQDDVDDIVKLVAAAGLSTPMVVAAHSYGGLIADLLARTHPELVNGFVLVDQFSEFLPRLGRPEQDAARSPQAGSHAGTTVRLPGRRRIHPYQVAPPAEGARDRAQFDKLPPPGTRGTTATSSDSRANSCWPRRC
jgi:pimeloyl-ACP methyl ester carboxylesterase